MSTPIKPSGARGVGDVGSAESPESEGAFADATARAGRAGGASVARGELLQSLAADLAAGRIDGAQAVDRLVTATLGGGAAEALPSAERARLESMLRAALAEDPALVAMQKDLARGG